jgi:hypothetical protein
VILAIWLTLNPSFAIDINDHIVLSLAGGEQVDGWFLRPEAKGVVLSIPSVGETASVPLSIVESVRINDADVSLSEFGSALSSAWMEHTRWIADPPAHPPPFVPAASSLILAGSGHALLGEWDVASGMLIGDTIFMGVMGLEAVGHGTGRLDVLLSAAALSALFKAYGMSDSHRVARRRRDRLGLAGGLDEKSPS